jgi:hypothetical protein
VDAYDLKKRRYLGVPWHPTTLLNCTASTLQFSCHTCCDPVGPYAVHKWVPLANHGGYRANLDERRARPDLRQHGSGTPL